jgi:hypothetical protein
VLGATKLNNNRLLGSGELSFYRCAAVGATVVDDDVVELLS